MCSVHGSDLKGGTQGLGKVSVDFSKSLGFKVWDLGWVSTGFSARIGIVPGGFRQRLYFRV